MIDNVPKRISMILVEFFRGAFIGCDDSFVKTFRCLTALKQKIPMKTSSVANPARNLVSFISNFY